MVSNSGSPEQLHADVVHLVQFVQRAFFHLHPDVGCLARLVGLDQPDLAAADRAAGVAQRDRGVERLGHPVALLLISIAHPLFVFFELAFVEGLVEQVLEPDGMRDADGMSVLHRPDHFLLAEHM